MPKKVKDGVEEGDQHKVPRKKHGREYIKEHTFTALENVILKVVEGMED